MKALLRRLAKKWKEKQKKRCFEKIKQHLIKDFISGRKPDIKQIRDLGQNKGLILVRRDGSEVLIELKQEKQ